MQICLEKNSFENFFFWLKLSPSYFPSTDEGSFKIKFDVKNQAAREQIIKNAWQFIPSVQDCTSQTKITLIIFSSRAMKLLVLRTVWLCSLSPQNITEDEPVCVNVKNVQQISFQIQKIIKLFSCNAYPDT